MNTAQRCFIKKPQDINVSYEAAIHENPANKPRSASTRPKRAVAKHTNFWAPGRTLRIAFLDGDQTFKDAVKAAALTWQPHINLTLDFVEGVEGEIRITSTRAYYWSYIGTNALLETDGATMSLPPQLWWYGFRPNVIHEFGHALGAEHEHLHPEVNIPWNKQAVYEVHGATEEDNSQNRYIKREVDEIYFDTLDPSEVNYSPYDRLSIMHYEVRQEWTNGDFEIELNEVLSEGDKAFMAKAYPYPEAENE